MNARHVTPHPWVKPGKGRYGVVASYGVAAAWLAPCRTVADWGGGGGFFRRYLPMQGYTLIDGTAQGVAGQVLADLRDYREPSDGILLRHVLDCTPDWRLVLANALAAFRQRLVVVTFTPFSSSLTETEAGPPIGDWPVWHFTERDLHAAFAAGGARLARVRLVPPGQDEDQYEPERVYCLERRKERT